MFTKVKQPIFLRYIIFFRCDKDYEELIKTLKTLSSEPKQEIMVPMGKKAFLPGQVCTHIIE